MACIGGKFLAAQSSRPLLGASGEQAGVMFALSTPQAAATLASTTVGFEIGLFSDSVVNAVLVLIFVSVVVATLVAEHYKVKVEIPPPGSRAIGEHVLVAIAELEPAPVALRLAGGSPSRRRGSSTCCSSSRPKSPVRSAATGSASCATLCRRLGIDADPQIRVTDHFARAILHAASDRDASMVLAVDGEREAGGAPDWPGTVAATTPPRSRSCAAPSTCRWPSCGSPAPAKPTAIPPAGSRRGCWRRSRRAAASRTAAPRWS